MAGNPYKKVGRGDRLSIPALIWNAILGLVAGPARSGGPGAPHRPRPPTPQTTIVLVKNDSGGAVGRFGVLGINAATITPAANLAGFQNAPVMSGITPAAGHRGKFAILTAPAAAGRIVQAIVAGITVCQVSIAHAGHRFCDVKAADATMLLSAAVGAGRILWAQAGTGTKWALVALRNGAGTYGTPDDILPVGGSFETEAAQSDTWTRDSPGGGKDGLTLRLQTRTAYNHAGDEKLYAYWRQLTYDSTGLLVSVSAETRVEIDAPEACP